MEAWAQGRYGEAIGRGTFEVVSSVLGGKGLDKLGKLGSIAGKLDKVGDIADVLTAAKRANTAIPDELAGIADELINIKRVEGKLGDVIDAASNPVLLMIFLTLVSSSANEINELVKLGKLSPEEAATMMKFTECYTLPAASTSSPSGVRLECSGGILLLRFDYNIAGVSYQSGLRFEKVRAYTHVAELHCPAWKIEESYDQLVEVLDSKWISALLNSTSDDQRDSWQLNHYILDMIPDFQSRSNYAL